MRHHESPPVVDETSTFVGLLKGYAEEKIPVKKSPVDPSMSKQLEAAALWTREAYVIVRPCCAHTETSYIFVIYFFEHDSTSIFGHVFQEQT